MTTQDDITAAIAGIHSRLEMLASITESNILIPDGPQERYHAIIEEAYVVLGLIETQVGPALRKRPRSRKVDKCGTVWIQSASDVPIV